MRAVVYQEPFKVTVEQMPDPKIEAPNDAVVRMTTTNTCGSDLHMYEGEFLGIAPAGRATGLSYAYPNRSQSR